MSTTPTELGKYTLLERLGHGGVAEVWKALDTHLQRHVAIKLLKPNLREDPQFLTRFQREAQLIASLHHPNIVQIHDFQVVPPDEHTAPVAYMVMDYIEGQTLAAYIQEASFKGLLPSPATLVNIFASISLAVDYAHSKGMVHRDIKPANILLDAHNTTPNPMGEPILTDFGLAKLLNTTTNTMSGAQLGTPLYTSPEQARGYPGNERSDLYSLGVILYEMLTGHPPFRASTPQEVLMQHVYATPDPPSQVSASIAPALTNVVMTSLAKDPAARFSSAAALTIALAEALQVPVPDSLAKTPQIASAVDMPTRFAGWSSSPGLTPGPISSSSQPGIAVSQQPGIPSAGFTPVMLQAGARVSPQPSANVTGLSTVVAPDPVSLPPPASKPVEPGRRPGRLYLILVPVVIVALLFSALGVYLLLGGPLQPPAKTSIGNAFFLSSGQIQDRSAQGVADQLRIRLNNVSNPQAGKSYYAWLLPDRHPETNPDLTGPRPIKPPILLTSNLPVQNGVIDYLYQGDAQHNNLISTASRLLITEEDAQLKPTTPTQDRTKWRYYAEIPQAQIAGDKPGFSALVHIRHLFYNETNAKVKGLFGGLDTWMFRNTAKLMEWSISARDNWRGDQTSDSDIRQMNGHFVRILDYIDGLPNRTVDMPADTPILVSKHNASIALLTVDAQHQGATPENPVGYVDHVQKHVLQVSKAPDVSPETRQRTARILDAVNRAKSWLIEVHDDAAKLFQLRNNPDQLRLPSTRALLDDMVSKATYAYIGQLDPTTNMIKPGVLQAHYEIQQLANLVVTDQLPKSI